MPDECAMNNHPLYTPQVSGVWKARLEHSSE